MYLAFHLRLERPSPNSTCSLREKYFNLHLQHCKAPPLATVLYRTKPGFSVQFPLRTRPSPISPSAFAYLLVLPWLATRRTQNPFHRPASFVPNCTVLYGTDFRTIQLAINYLHKPVQEYRGEGEVTIY